jgi:hypothetical protein
MMVFFKKVVRFISAPPFITICFLLFFEVCFCYLPKSSISYLIEKSNQFSPQSKNIYSQLPGFPLYFDNGFNTNFQTANINDIEGEEIVIGNYNGKFYVFNAQGNLLNGWPKIFGTYFVGDPALYDVDDDGTLEIYQEANDPNVFPMKGYCWNYSGNDMPNWPFWNPYNGVDTMSIDDINLNGEYKFFAKGRTNTTNVSSKIWGWDKFSSLLEHWPYEYYPLTQERSTIAGAIADLDNDGVKEVIFALDDNSTTIYALKPDGSNLNGFPISLNAGTAPSRIIIGDIDGDGFKEIIFGASRYLWVLNHDGTLKTGWPKQTWFSNYDPICEGYKSCGGGATPSLGDVDEDGLPEIACGTSGSPYTMFFLFKGDGTILSGWPIYPKLNAGSYGPVIGDINGDCVPEIVFPVTAYPSNLSGLYGYSIYGNLVQNFPVYTLTTIGGISPVLTDLNGDGCLDIGIATDSIGSPFGTLEFFNLAPNPYNRSCIEWPMAHFDIRNTGRYRKLYQIDKNSSFTVDKTAIPADGESKMLLTACATTEGQLPSNFNGDLSGQDVRFARNPKNGEFTGPIIDYHDGSYSRYLVAPLSDDPLTTNLMCWINEFKLNTIILVTFWGRPVVSSFSPQVVRAGSSYTISITGRNYPSDITAISDSPDTQITGLNRVSDTEAQINVNVSSSAVGYQDLKLFGYQRYSDPISLIAYQPDDLLLLGTKPNLTDAQMNWYGLEEPPGITFKLIRATNPDFSDAEKIYEGTNRNYIDPEIPNQIYYYKVEY